MENETNYLRYNGDSGTCSKDYSGFIDGFFSKMQDTFFYVNLLQVGLVLLMYYNIGRGRYWKLLHMAAIANFYGAIVENATVSFICRKSVKNKDYKWVVPFLLAEIGWIIGEYTIPFLNLTKLKTLSDTMYTKYLNYVIIYGLFPLFISCRIYIGYNRMKYGVLTTAETKYGHAAAFTVMALSDVLCTVAILYCVKKNNNTGEEITNYIKRSSYNILLIVDSVGILLAIMNAITEYIDVLPGSLVIPFHCIKCSVILILSVDALLFKYNFNVSTIHAPEPDDEDDNNTDDADNINNISAKKNNKSLSLDYNCSYSSKSFFNNNCVVDSSNFNIYSSVKA